MQPKINPWKLPTSIKAGGGEYIINTDFRKVLAVLKVMKSPDYEEDEKWAICLRVLLPEWESLPPEDYPEAADAIRAFLDAGIVSDGKKRPSTMDWEKDAPIIIPAVNSVLGEEIRSMEHLHWWTFIGAYMEIGQCLFSSVVSIRAKQARGEKLDKEEKRFIRENAALVAMPQNLHQRSEEEKKALRALIGKG